MVYLGLRATNVNVGPVARARHRPSPGSRLYLLVILPPWYSTHLPTFEISVLFHSNVSL